MSIAAVESALTLTLSTTRLDVLLATLRGAPDAQPEAVAAHPLEADVADVRRTLGGDHNAYRRIVERHQPQVGRIMWRFTRDRNEHEELAHQVFVTAYLSLASYRGQSPLEHWLARIATRVGYRYWKHRHQHRRMTALPMETWQRLIDATDHSDRDAAELAHHLLDQLPPRDRLVLTLRYIDQHDTAATAALTGWTRTRVRVQAHRAMGRLRKLALEAGIELEPS